MPDTFVALDVETANPDVASICQIGVARFDGGCEVDAWASLVDPQDYFDEINVAIHGIDEDMVRDSPSFLDIAPHLARYLADQIVVSHMPFDRLAIQQASARNDTEPIACTWLDSARVARRTWTQFATKGYGLANVAAHCGVEFKHHDALEDARACGRIMLHAVKHTGLSVQEWIARSQQPIDPSGSHSGSHISRAGNPSGPLAGEVLVFTGALSMPRREAADLAAQVGCDVASSVGKKTTLLVVGDQDIRRLAGHEKSSKHRKAEQLFAQGHPIRILAEADFRALAHLH